MDGSVADVFTGGHEAGKDAPGPDATLHDAGAPDTGKPEGGGPVDAEVDAPWLPVAAPTFMPMPGPYMTAQKVSIYTATPNATILYTTDGTTPNANSTVYGGPFTIASTTTVEAYATAPGMLDSTVAVGQYDITPCPGLGPAPKASPAPGTYASDQLVSLTGVAAGTTICFTLDGSPPACSSGACTGTSVEYSAQTRIPVNATVTDPKSGDVTITAGACYGGPCGGISIGSPMTYTLRVAQPKFASPGPGTVAYPGASPTVTTSTPGSDVQIFTSTTGSVSCSTGTPVPPPYPAKVSVTEDVTLSAIACKPGYLASKVTTASYSVQLAQPTFSPASTTPMTAAQPNALVTVTNPNAIGTLCVTTDGSDPACNGGTCTHGTQATGPTASVDVPKNGASLRALVCADPYTDSNIGQTGAYTLRLDAVAIAPAAGTPVGPDGTLAGVQITNSGPASDQPYTFVCWSTDGTSAPDCACAGATAANTAATVGPGLYKSDGSATPMMTVQGAVTDAGPEHITVRAVGCDGSPAAYAPSNKPYASATW
jgi:hypothetical protein